jgi:indole-3-glycerol phosphate synthase
MILDTIAAATRIRVAENKKTLPFTQMRNAAEALGGVTGFPFHRAVAAPELSFICEVKQASPSKGIIATDFPYQSIALEYAEAGAAAISVLTEPDYFKGSDRYLQDIAATVNLPLLRKDFTIDPYQIYQARCLGAAAVLLIVTLLDVGQLKEYLAICNELGLSALVETHDEAEVEIALTAGAAIIGVNNRNLQTFEVDITTSHRLRSLIPHDRLFISESGIAGPDDIALLRTAKVDGVLIGETLMRCADKKAALTHLRTGKEHNDQN